MCPGELQLSEEDSTHLFCSLWQEKANNRVLHSIFNQNNQTQDASEETTKDFQLVVKFLLKLR